MGAERKDSFAEIANFGGNPKGGTHVVMGPHRKRKCSTF